jgi:hypothetical protein
MDEQLVGTLRAGDYKAEVFSLSIPGEFRVEYQGPGDTKLEEDMLAGISTYKQREREIVARLHELAGGATPRETKEAGDAGEY